MAHADTDVRTPPPVRIGCLALIVNYSGHVLMVRPTYKPGGFYQLPGGGAHEGEPDWEAVVREVREETGLEVKPERLVAKDWIPVNEDTGAAAGHNFVYYCGSVPDHTQVTLPSADGGEPAEVDDARWIAPGDLDRHCAPYQARRVRAALAAYANGTVAELAFGESIYQASV